MRLFAILIPPFVILKKSEVSKKSQSCHTEEAYNATEVSQSKTKNRDISVSSKPQYDKIKNTKESIIARHIATLQSISICDPSVGSGHFLVSALNEMIYIYHALGLTDTALQRCEIVVHNDEIHISQNGIIFAYQKPNANNPNQAIQKSLFSLKKSIIESNLYGVDINPNSVEICKLRLWIELLKNSYYLLDGDEGYLESLDSTIHQMQTLPNIDINIKCGNSLVSYFDLGQSLSHYPNIATKIKDYQETVRNYKEGTFDSRKQINDKIYELHQSFRNFCFSDKFEKEIKSFRAKCESYSKKYGNFLAKDDKNLRLYVAQMFGYFTFDEKQARIDFENLKKEYESIFNLESNKPFEWRFEFPEVLDSNGDFMGFDLVIGNPPYISQEEIKELKPNLAKTFSIYSSTSDIYTYFYEQGLKLLKDNGILSLITSNKFCRAGYGENLRKLILKSVTMLDFVDLSGIKVFAKATVDTCVINMQKSKPNKLHKLNYAHPTQKDLSNLNFRQITQNSLNTESFIFADVQSNAIRKKIENIGVPLKEWNIVVNSGIKTGYNEAFIIDSATKDKILAKCKTDSERERTSQIIKKMLKGRHIKKYGYAWENLWLINMHNGYTKPNGDKIPPIDINDYPALKAHFDKKARIHKGKGKGFWDRDDMGVTAYNLRNCAYIEDFDKPKIIFNKASQINAFYLDKWGEYYGDVTTYILSAENLCYLLGILNSQMFYFAYNTFYAGGGIEGEITLFTLEKFPIPKPNVKNQKIVDKIVSLVEKILEFKAQNKTLHCHTERSEVSQSKIQNRDISVFSKPQYDKTLSRDISAFSKPQYDKKIDCHADFDKSACNDEVATLEQEIDELVYALYGLSDEEINILHFQNLR